MCGADSCRAAYYRAWHADKRREHPERYGSAFYSARGKPRPGRAARQRPPPKWSWFTPRQAERLEALIAWLGGRWFGATKAQLLERFDDFYPDCRPRTASERRFYRDLADVRATGRFVWAQGRLILAGRAHALPDPE